MTYLGMLLPWALPVIVLQWTIGRGALLRRLRILLVATLVPTVYLVGADSVALSQGIWTIHRDRILGVYIGNVPLEEAIFFLVTDLMVVQSVMLFNAPELRLLLRRLARRMGRA